MNTSKRIVYIPSDADKARAGEFSTLGEAKTYARRYGYKNVVATLVETTTTNLFVHDVSTSKDK